jgi:hypothetical protein
MSEPRPPDPTGNPFPPDPNGQPQPAAVEAPMPTTLEDALVEIALLRKAYHAKAQLFADDEMLRHESDDFEARLKKEIKEEGK